MYHATKTPKVAHNEDQMREALATGWHKDPVSAVPFEARSWSPPPRSKPRPWMVHRRNKSCAQQITQLPCIDSIILIARIQQALCSRSVVPDADRGRLVSAPE
jgi:hypothetical protein